MFRQSGDSAAPASRSGEVLTTSSGGGAGTDVNLVSVGGDPIALGQTVMADSLPVVIASDQSPIPISGSITATNPSVDATGGAVPADATYIGINIGGNLTGPVGGHGTAAGALRVELPTDGTGVIATVGAVTAITNALPAGSNVIGHVIADTGSTTAVTGNVTVVQPTGTNLHAVIDSGSVTVVQPTAANLNATVTVAAGSAVIGHVITDATSTTIATQGTATNLKAQVTGAGSAGTADTGVQTIQGIASMTPVLVAGTGTAGTAASAVVTVQGVASMTPVQVSQATAASLNATVVGAGTAGTANAGVVTVQGIASMTKLLVTPDSVALPANQSVNLAQVNGTTTVNGGSAAGILAVGGPNATNVAITGNPTNTGAQAVSAENAAVTAGRLVQLVADLAGKLIVLPYANPENFVSGAITSAMTGTTSTSLIGAPASGLRNYITQITVSNAHATVGTDVIIQDGSGGTTLYTIPAAAVYGGAAVSFPTPLRQPTTATAIYCANVTTGASTKVSASGYKGA